MNLKNKLKLVLRNGELLLLAVFCFFVAMQFLFGFLVKAAAPWYNSDWQYRRKITVNSSQVATNLTNFPIVISEQSSSFAHTLYGGRVGQLDGGDFLFTSDDGVTKLSHEIEFYNYSTGKIVAWVKAPTLSMSSNTEFYMYYGNAFADDQWDASGSVWSNGFEVVQHFNEDCTGLFCLKNSVDNTNHASQSSGFKIGGGGNFYVPSGKIGPDIALNGVNEFLEIADSPDLELNDDFTIEMWVRNDESNKYSDILSKGSYGLKLDPDGRFFFDVYPAFATETWSTAYTLPSTSYRVVSLVEYDGYLYAMVYGTASLIPSSILRSADGNGWSSAYSIGNNIPVGNMAVYDGVLYAAINSSVYSSDNGTSWTEVQDLEVPINSLVVHGGRLFAGLSTSGQVYYTDDGASFTLAKDFSNAEGTNVGQMHSFNGYLWLGMTDTGKVFNSTKGTSWTQVFSDGTYNLFSGFGFLGNRFVLALRSASVATLFKYDDQFDSWASDTPIPAGFTASNIYAQVAYLGRGFMSTGADGKIYYRTAPTAAWTEEADLNTTYAMTNFKGNLFAGGDRFIYRRDNGGVHYRSTTESTPTTYNHVAFTVRKSNFPWSRLLINGQQEDLVKVVFDFDSNSLPLLLGKGYGPNHDALGGGSGEGLLEGRIDEFRISGVERSDEWVATSYNSQNSPATFYTLGAEEMYTPPEEEEEGSVTSGDFNSVTRVGVSGEILGGVLTMVGYGDFVNGMMIGDRELVVQGFEQSNTWTGESENDYFVLEDSTAVDGFRLQMSLIPAEGATGFVNNFYPEEQIPLSNLKLFPSVNDESGLNQAPFADLGVASATFDINSEETCLESESPELYVFHDSLTAENYGLALSSSAQNVLYGNNHCVLSGTLRLKKLMLLVPEGQFPGSYAATLNIVLLDGNE